ncbi:MAG TPA: tail fiber domain-containing protein [Pyrinomonadaceae bacterium]|nr:tail fiber domain-containing protein [Pyrinomonadaceae bacterium]
MNRNEQPKRRQPVLRVYLLAAFTLTILFGYSDSAFAQSQWATSGNDIYNTNSGKVGIGTSTPFSPLHVVGAADTTTFTGVPFNLAFTSNNTAAAGVGAGISFGGAYTGTTLTGFAVISGVKENGTDGNFAGALMFSTRANGPGMAATEKMRITSAGDVGIGTTAPGYKLDVQSGQINASGGLCIGGDCVTSWEGVPGNTDASNLTTGTLDNARLGVVPVSKGGTGLTSAGTSGNFLRSDGTGFTSSALQASDVPDLSASYIRNQTGSSQSGGFNVSGTGTASVFNATTQFNLGGNLALSSAGANNITVGGSADTVQIPGRLQVTQLSGGGNNHLCRNTSNQVADCSSSLRYKTNVAPFSFGLSLVRRLRPIRFEWKDGGMKDVGFGAEEVAAVEPMFATYNDKGEVEGVKYDRISVALVNAVKEQQGQIEAQQTQLKQQQAQIAAQQQQLKQQQTLIDGLKKLLCRQDPSSDVCL